MNKVIACVDGTAASPAVGDYAAWAARRLAVPLEFVHVLDWHPEHAVVTDYIGSIGSIGLGAQESLLQELNVLDEKRSVLAQRHGRELLDRVVRRAVDAGVTAVESRQCHGPLVEALLELEPEACLIVLGQHQPPEKAARRHLDHNVERAIRSLQRPVLVAAAGFRQPRHFAIAFDGSVTGRKMIAAVASSPLLKGLRCDVVMAGEETASTREQLHWAHTTLAAAGFETRTQMFAGELESVLPDYLKELSVDLLVMGAYGHSRIRHLIVGSTTTTLLRTSAVPVLVLR